MRKLLLISFSSAILLLGLSLGNIATAADEACTNKATDTPTGIGGTCETISSCPTTQGTPPKAFTDTEYFNTDKKTACINEYKGTTKDCFTSKCDGVWNRICCKPKTADTTTCTSPNTCDAITMCPTAADQITSANHDCASKAITKPWCCKPKCDSKNCNDNCAAPLTTDASKSTAECPVGKKTCCKPVGGTTNPSTGGDKTEGATYPLAPLSPVGDIDIPTLIGIIIKGVLGIVGSIALLMFVYGGFLMLISQGDAAKIKKGRDALIWAAAGLVVIFGSYIFVSYILSAVSKGGA
jgi:hypothetical protein